MDEFLIVRLSSLGDILHTLPAFAALRKGFSGARISWIVEKSGKEILDLVPGIDGIIVRGEKGWLGKARGRARTALDFQGLIKSAVIARLSGAWKRIGFSGKNLRERAAAGFYTDRLPEFPEDGHVINKNLRLLGMVGLKPDIDPESYEFPLSIPDSARQSVRKALADLGWRPGRGIVVCNVGAAWASKRWPTERWIELLNMTEKEGLFHILLWGNAAERETALAIGAGTGTSTAPFFSIAEVLALLSESRLLVSGDTFALQAACALDVPVVGIFGPTNPARNGPFRRRDRAACLEMDCWPCYQRTCASDKCLAGVPARDVDTLIREILENHA
jgi:heptosyltransferase I